jgi:hypothetical protein
LFFLCLFVLWYFWLSAFLFLCCCVCLINCFFCFSNLNQT